jgi:hypothetical protein
MRLSASELRTQVPAGCACSESGNARRWHDASAEGGAECGTSKAEAADGPEGVNCRDASRWRDCWVTNSAGLGPG